MKPGRAASSVPALSPTGSLELLLKPKHLLVPGWHGLHLLMHDQAEVRRASFWGRLCRYKPSRRLVFVVQCVVAHVSPSDLSVVLETVCPPLLPPDSDREGFNPRNCPSQLYC
uniref:Uncharacterized protein n=1 Tax=Sphaerodactylus townsendi TaxID=933632 RepID=A0ACB8F161_9SAUR